MADHHCFQSSVQVPCQEGETKWQNVRNWLQHQIESGTLKHQERMPSLRSVAQQFQVSLITVQRAFADLEADALVQAIPRKGYFVSGAVGDRRPHDFSTVEVGVNHAVVDMLVKAACPDSVALGSAVLDRTLAPNALLKRCMAAVARKGHDGFELCPPPGDLELRKRIAGIMGKRGVICSADDVIITGGDTVALELCLRAIAKPGDHIIVEDPTYFGILQAIEQAGMHSVPINTDRDTGICLDQVMKMLRIRRCAGIFLNPTLHNPLGFVMPGPHRRRLATLAEAAGVSIIEDDVFYDLLCDVERVQAIKSFSHANVLYCSSFTKTIGAGLRVGWCIPGRHHAGVLAQMFSRNLSVASLPQHVLSEFIRRDYGSKHLPILRDRLSKTSLQLNRIIQNNFPEGTFYKPPAAGFVHWIELPANVDMDEVHRRTAAVGIVLAKSEIFSSTAAHRHCLRLCLASGTGSRISDAIVQIATIARQASVYA